MNFWGKTGGSGEDEEEKEQPKTDRLFSSSSASDDHQNHSRNQPELQQPFLSPSPYHHHRGGGLLFDGHNQVGESSTTYDEEGGGRTLMPVEREHMFDKVVTPSDVGKLNRLVIPKQHAERYFPLDSSNNDKGLLLNFEDMNGKMWRFRYSYWNSSQSYVMTKGWSRFVKEKKLDAGDIVSFQRGVGATFKDRLFIDWRRRINTSGTPPQRSNLSFSFPHNNLFHPWNPLVLKPRPAFSRSNPNLMLPPSNIYPSNYTSHSANVNNSGSRSVTYFRPPQHLQMIPPPLASTPPLHGKASGKRRLRLFGVNMDCPLSEDEDDQDYNLSITNPISLGQYYKYGDHHHGHHSPPPPLIPPSSSPASSSIPYLQLSPHGEGNECNNPSTILQSSSTHTFNVISKSTASSMSLDLDI